MSIGDDDDHGVTAEIGERAEGPRQKWTARQEAKLLELALRLGRGSLAAATCGEDRRRGLYPRTSSSIFSASSSLQFFENVSSETRI